MTFFHEWHFFSYYPGNHNTFMRMSVFNMLQGFYSLKRPSTLSQYVLEVVTWIIECFTHGYLEHFLRLIQIGLLNVILTHFNWRMPVLMYSLQTVFIIIQVIRFNCWKSKYTPSFVLKFSTCPCKCTWKCTHQTSVGDSNK